MQRRNTKIKYCTILFQWKRCFCAPDDGPICSNRVWDSEDIWTNASGEGRGYDRNSPSWFSGQLGAIRSRVLLVERVERRSLYKESAGWGQCFPIRRISTAIKYLKVVELLTVKGVLYPDCYENFRVLSPHFYYFTTCFTERISNAAEFEIKKLKQK